MSESPLSGVAMAPAIALCPGEPRLSVEVTNRLLIRHGLNRALARAVVHDAVAAVMPLDPEEELPLIATQVQALGLHSEAELEPWLAAQRWSRDDLRAMATLAERLRRWSHWRFEHEVEIRYLDRKADLDCVVYMQLQVAERELAEELHQRLRRGEMSFAAAVEQFSLGTERDTPRDPGPGRRISDRCRNRSPSAGEPRGPALGPLRHGRALDRAAARAAPAGPAGHSHP